MQLQDIPQQILSLWRNAQATTRLVWIAGLVLLLVAIVTVGFWSAHPQYMPLASGLAPLETAEVVSRLDAKGIGYQLNFSGSSVLVAKSDWNRARLVVDDIATFSASPDWEDGMLSDPEITREKLVHRREEALARTIRRMSGISQATVHIAVAERTPFQHAQLTTTASVVLELRANAAFTREQTAAIVALVAGSVEGLSPDGVSVMDTRGRICPRRRLSRIRTSPLILSFVDNSRRIWRPKPTRCSRSY